MSPAAATPTLDERLRQRPRAWLWWLAVLGCLVLAALVAKLHQRHGLQQMRSALQADARTLADQVESLSTDGKVMGSAMLMGLVDQEIKKLLAGQTAPDDPALRAAFLAVIGEYQADNVLVLDRTGRTRAYVAKDPAVRGLGRDLSVRPYFRRGIAGYTNLYPALGKNTGERGIYLAAPVRAVPDPQAEVIGVVVIKIGADKLDTVLARYPHAALLVSPDGIVFGGNRKQWLLRLTEPLGAEQRARLLREEQFGDLFSLGTPQAMALQVTDDGARLDGARVAVAEEQLDWPGVGRGWRLLLLRERTWADEWQASVALGLAVLAVGLGGCAYVRRRHWRLQQGAAAQRANEARMRGMLEAMPQGVAMLDAAGCIRYSNSALERLAGAPARSLVGQPLMHLLALKASPAEMLAACRAAPDQLVETELRPLNGAVIPVGLAVADFDDGGERHVMASLRDISARRRSQEAVARELAFQQRLIDTLPNPLFMKDAQGRYTTVNRAFEQAYGLRREHIVGLTVLERTNLDAEVREKAHRLDLKTIAEGSQVHGQFASMWADGLLHQTLFWGQGLADAEGRPVGMVGVLLDVTEQAEARATLHERELQLRNLLESAPGTVIVTNDEGRVLFHNQHALEMFRIDADTLARQGMRARYVDPVQRAELFERLRRDGHVRAAEVEMLRGDGTPFWAQISFSRGTYGQAANAAFGWSVDVTERKRTTEMLRAAKEAAEAATAAKSGFLANMSHEIRTPMNAIIGLAHLALQTRMTEQQRDYIQKVHHAARALLGIVNDILDFSKIEAGKLVIEQADFDLDAVIGQLATLTGVKAGDKQLELLFDIGDAVPRQLRGDALRLGQVLTNLITNAVKFTERGEIVVQCRHRVLQPGGALVLQFSVRDTGIGMTPEQVARMFVPFSQADESTTRRFGGTGLGLSICKRLIEAAGGDITVDSTLGQGSRFDFGWPCATAVAAQQPPQAPEAVRALRTLVVDGHAGAADILVRALQRLGLAVDRAADAAAALALLREAAGQHGLVFADRHLPDLDGLTLTRQIQAGPAPATVVLLAAQGDDALRRAAADAGAAAVLLKPVTQATLGETLASLYGDDLHERRPPAADAAPRLDGLRVLLVEDNEINQQIAVELMRAAGIAVDVAGHGRAGVDRLLAAGPDAFDLVLMDLQMPVMDGHRATLLIRAEPRFAALPIVAMTAHAMVEERQRCLEEGMNDHIAKPIDPDLLYRKLAQWGGRRGAAATAPAAAAGAGAAGLGADDPLLRQVPGLDAAAGLRRVLGRRPVYLQLLQRFAEDQADAVPRIRAALAQGDTASAERLAHTLKGVSANLGAGGVAAHAGELEDALRRQQPAAQRELLLAALQPALAALLDDLQRVLAVEADTAAAASTPALADGAAEAAFSALCEMLENMDGGVAEQLARLAPWLRQRLAPAQMQALERHVQRYDLDEALALLAEAPALAALQRQRGGLAAGTSP